MGCAKLMIVPDLFDVNRKQTIADRCKTIGRHFLKHFSTTDKQY